jgi:hypothetical protein
LVPPGKEVVVIDSPVSATAIDVVTDLVRAGLEESFIAMVIGKLPPVVGVPETIPVLVARLSPAGNLPEEIDQVYGVVPPVAVRAFEYLTPLVPDGKDVVVIESAVSSTASEVARDLVRTGLDESLTVIVTAKCPPTVGAPEIVPVLAARLSPGESFPAVMAQVYGFLPPAAVRVVE